MAKAYQHVTVSLFDVVALAARISALEVRAVELVMQARVTSDDNERRELLADALACRARICELAREVA